MKSFIPCGLWSLALSLPLACASAEGTGGTADEGADFATDLDGPSETGTLRAAASSFPGGGTSGAAQPLSAALAPESSSECDPEPSADAPASQASVQTVCFYDPAVPEVPAAAIEQVVEVVGNTEWVHVRLTLNPDFVDNTYGDTAIGWDADPADTAAPAPVAAPPPPNGPASALPPAPQPERPEPRGGKRPGKDGHTFRDLVGSDHAEMQLLDANGGVAMHFKIDYISASEAAPSGFASLGVSGGEGALIAGEPEWILAATTSLDRNLNACGLSSFTESSPLSDALYTPAPSASDWDYRVAYEVWVSTEAFGAAGFGSALIENVHASPSKLESNTVDVSPAPCPSDPDVPEAVPEPVPVVLQNIR